jgi:hypothetical protein
VLSSDLLPPRLEDEQLKDVLRSLPDNPTAYQRVVDALFATSTSQAAAAASAASAATGGKTSGGAGVATAGGVTSGTSPAAAAAAAAAVPLAEMPGAPLPVRQEVVAAVVRAVKWVGHTVGAVTMTSSPLGAWHPALPPEAVRLLSPSGAQVGGDPGWG